MVLLANRVRASEWPATIASTSCTPCERAALATCSKTSVARRPSSGIGAPDADSAKTRGAGAVPGPHHLLRLSFAAVRNSPQRPVLASGNGGARIPEFRRDSAVARILQHADAFAAADLPADLAPELEVVPFVVDGPAAVRLHVDGMIGIEHFFERLPPRLEADVGHANQRNPRPSIRAHAAVGTRVAHLGGGFARGHVPHKFAVPDDVGGLRRHAFVIEGKRAEPRPVFQARIADDVDDFRSIPQFPQLIEREKAHSGVVGFASQDAIELYRMADRLVNLQADLGAVENQVEDAFGTLIGRMERDGLFGDPRRVFQEAQFVYQFVSLQLVLPAEGIGVRPLLNFTVLVTQGRKSGAGRVAGLVDEAA